MNKMKFDRKTKIYINIIHVLLIYITRVLADIVSLECSFNKKDL